MTQDAITDPHPFVSISGFFGRFQSKVENALQALRAQNIIERIWQRDHTVWKPQPKEIADRLGWLDCPWQMAPAVSEISAFVDGLRNDGFTRAVLLGMGGSSLAAEVLHRVFGVQDGYLDLAVLDTTDPDAVLAQRAQCDAGKTLFLVSTKSGGTIETVSLMKYFYAQTCTALGRERAGAHFAAITDPGSGLEKMANDLHFRKIFRNDPEIGGRYSALSFFGLVPAGLIGMDLPRMLANAQAMAGNARPANCPVQGTNTAAWLGAVMAELAAAGRDKLTLLFPPALEPFGLWLEQLIAESTGKEGCGILPVMTETLLPPENYGRDRLFVEFLLDGERQEDDRAAALQNAGHPFFKIHLRNFYDLCGEFFRWEMATAVAGWRLGINPFDQPNVESAKVRAREMIAVFQESGRLPELTPQLECEGMRIYGDIQAENVSGVFESLLAGIDPDGGAYVALQAFVTPTPNTDTALKRLQRKVQLYSRLAVTMGYGPRFLHSTGQLHKGDAGKGLFIQITADSKADAIIPDEAGRPAGGVSFGTLIAAQALGDRQALIDAGRKIVRFHCTMDPALQIRRLSDAVESIR